MAFDWKRARARDREAKKHLERPKRRWRGKHRTDVMAKWAAERELACFVCGEQRPAGGWAKTGVSARGPWAICVNCVREGRK